MSENANDKPDSKNLTYGTDQPAEATLGRRLFFFKAAAIVTGAAAITAATAIGTATEAEAQRCTDRDSFNPRGGGRWCRGRRRRYCTDRDSFNPRGGGRWCR